MLVLFLLVSAPLSALAQANDEAEASIDQTHEPVNSAFSEAERLATAARHGTLMPSAVQVAVNAFIQRCSSFASGSFDPLLGDGPEVPTSWNRLHDASYTGMVLIQLDQADGNLLDALVKQHGLLSSTWSTTRAGSSVRLDARPVGSMDELRAEDGVQLGRTTSTGLACLPQLLYHSGRAPASTLYQHRILSVGGTLCWPPIWSGSGPKKPPAMHGCASQRSPESGSELVQHLARDGRILWTEPALELRVHNALAWSIAGVQAVANNGVVYPQRLG